MVKELTMDNSIFAVSAKKSDTLLSESSNVSVKEFENAFETAKNNTNYTDKTDVKSTNEKVINVAEKSVARDKKSSDATSTDVTKVSKKVSNKLTKSPKSATNVHQSKATVHSKNDTVAKDTGMKISEDACTFSVKSELQNAQTVENVPANSVDSALQSDEATLSTLPEVSIDDDATVKDVTIDSSVVDENTSTVMESVDDVAETVKSQVALDIALQLPNVKIVEKAAVAEVVEQQANGEIESTVETTVLETPNQEVETENTTQQPTIKLDKNWVAVDENEAKEILEQVESTLEQGSVEQMDSSVVDEVSLDVQNSIDIQTEEILAKQPIKETPVEQNSIETNNSQADEVSDDGVSSVVIEEQEILADDVEQLTGGAAEIVELNEEEDIFIEETVQDAEETVSSEVVVDETAEETPVDTKTVLDDELSTQDDTQILKEETLATDEQIEKTVKDVKDDNVELETFESVTSEDTIVTNKVATENEAKNSDAKVDIKDVEEDVTLDTQKIVVNEDDVDVNVEAEPAYTTTQKVADAIEKVATTTRPTVSSNDEEDEDEENSVADDLLLEEVSEVVEGQEEITIEVDTNFDLVSKEENSFEKSHKDATENYSNEDLDLYIDNCVKLAFIDTSSHQGVEDVDVISALETKFEDSYVQEDVELDIPDVDIDEYENVSSLEELVDVAEVETLGLRLKDATSTKSDNVVTTISTSTTTEQLIRYSIEGDNSNLNKVSQFEFSKFAPETVKTAQQEVSGKEILSQLSEKLSTFSFKAGSKLTMQLNPENLGKIELTLRNTTEGIIAEMTASSDDAADMLKKNLDDLKETLQKYGVRFDNVSVKTTSAQHSAQNQDYTQQEGNQKQQQEQKRDSERQDKKQFEEMMNSFTEEDKE